MSARRLSPLALALLVLFAGSPAKAEFEKPFAPVEGSRWLIEDSNDIEIVNAGGATETQKIRQKGEIVFGAKTGEGYRAAYTATEMSLEGTSAAVKIAGPALQVMKGVTFQVVTDARGKPVRVENLDETRKKMGEMVERLAAAAGAPNVAQAMRNLMTPLISMTGADAAQAYAEPLNAMSVGQATGMKLDEVRTETEQRPNPFGGDPLKVVMTTRIAQPDPAQDLIAVSREESYDRDSIKAASLLMARRILSDVGKETVGAEHFELEKLANAMKFTLESFSAYSVRGGMTRNIQTRTRIELTAMGTTFSKLDQRSFKITEAP